MSLTSLLVPTFSQMLRALSAWLDKAKDQHADAEGLLSARLAADMFPLSTQVRFACIQAYEAIARLTGEPFPAVWRDLLDEGRDGDGASGGLAGAQARIAETLSVLDALAPDALDAGADRAIAHDLPNGMVFDMTGVEYARDWALPHFYFHVMAAYAILRHHGVDLGKSDYVRHAFPFLRAGTAPGSSG